MVDIDSHVAGVEQTHTGLILVAMRLWHHKKHLHAVLRKTFCHAETSCAETASDMRRKLPTKHQDSHSFYFLVDILELSMSKRFISSSGLYFSQLMTYLIYSNAATLVDCEMQPRGS